VTPGQRSMVKDFCKASRTILVTPRRGCYFTSAVNNRCRVRLSTQDSQSLHFSHPSPTLQFFQFLDPSQQCYDSFNGFSLHSISSCSSFSFLSTFQQATTDHITSELNPGLRDHNCRLTRAIPAPRKSSVGLQSH
jgi:hypothetical protein